MSNKPRQIAHFFFGFPHAIVFESDPVCELWFSSSWSSVSRCGVFLVRLDGGKKATMVVGLFLFDRRKLGRGFWEVSRGDGPASPPLDKTGTKMLRKICVCVAFGLYLDEKSLLRFSFHLWVCFCVFLCVWVCGCCCEKLTLRRRAFLPLLCCNSQEASPCTWCCVCLLLEVL
jgi:hypothetical protein